MRIEPRARRTASVSEPARVCTTPPLLERGVALRQRRLRGAARGGDVDADRGIGLGPDHLREVAGFARALRRARAGLDEEVLAVVGG